MVNLLTVLPSPQPIYNGYHSPWDDFFRVLSDLPIYWIIGALSAIFVYHESNKRKHEFGLLWAFGAFLLWPVVLILYFLYQHFHREGFARSDKGLEISRKTYFYFASFIALFILFWGLADLGRIILGHIWDPHLKSVYIYDSFKRGVSFRFSTILVTLPLWIFHYFKAIEPPLNSLEKKQKRNYSLTVLGIMSFFVLIFGISLLYQTLNFLLGVSTTTLYDFSLPLGYFPVSIITWFYHFQLFRETEKELKREKNNKR